MTNISVTFDEAVRILDTDNGWPHSAGISSALVDQVIRGDGVSIVSPDRQVFVWSLRPGSPRAAHGNVVNTGTDGWEFFEEGQKVQRIPAPMMERLDPAWRYDASALAAALHWHDVRITVDGLRNYAFEVSSQRGDTGENGKPPRKKTQTEQANADDEAVSVIVDKIVNDDGYRPIAYQQLKARVNQKNPSLSGAAFDRKWSTLDPKFKLKGAPETPGN
jgi:hypothetical protein